MRKFTLSMLVLFVSVFFLTQSVFSQGCENFDSYASGDYVAVVVPGWTTWSNNPGSAEDALITDAMANSLANSYIIEGGTDLVQLFADANITSGAYEYSNMIYVPAGFTGYFNLQKDIVPGVEWGFQVMFDADGTASADAGAEAAAVFDFTFDEWHSNTVIVDLDNDYAEYWFDGTLMVAWPWSLGTFGTAGAMTVGGANYYANAGIGDPMAYFDDVCFDEYVVGGDCEDFDALAVGTGVAEQLGGNWTTWSGTGADDAMVSDAQSNSPDNSFVVDAGAVDLILQFGADPLAEGQWLYSHYIYVPTGFSGYFNVQTEPTPGVGWNLDLYFDDGGTGAFAGQSTETFVYDQDTWIMVEINYDLDAGLGEVYFDGVLMLGFVNDLTIGGIDYYGSDSGGDPGAYFDDVCFGPGWPITGAVCEDFDALTVGTGVAEQLGGNWTTWSGTAADDAMVTDAQSNSSSNSFVVDAGAVDLILQFGDEPIAEGQWLYSHYIYVPTGFSGYFNVQTEPTPGVGWNLDLYFDDGGTGAFAGQSTETFAYNQDTWIMVEINYDLDAGLGEVYFDGVLMLEFVNDLTIGGIDYYGSDSGGDPGAYFDDVCFGPGWEISGADCEDFDALAVGTGVAEQLGGYWTTWSGTAADDAMVSDAQSNSPDNSFVVDAGAVDLIFQFGDDPIDDGLWLYSNYIYVPTGFSGYFNVQTEPTPGVGWNLELFFDDGGTGYFAGQATETFDYNQDTWIFVEINYDLVAGLGAVYFDGQLMSSVFTNTMTIGSIDYYGSDGGGAPGAYYDDVCFGPGWSLVGIEEPVMSTNTVVYPNPATDKVTIESESIINEVRIYNNMGQLVYSGEFNNDQVTVNTSNFITGMYIVQVRSGKAIEVRKLIIE